MIFKKKFLPVLIFIFLIAGVFISSQFFFSSKTNKDTLKPTETKESGRTKVKYPQDYTIVMVGDSMTEVLGNSDELRAYLKKDYPGKTFEVLNYGFGSTNVLSVKDRLEKDTFHGRVFRPVLDIDFDLILIESFGHNPLSQFPLDVGLKKQTEALEEIVNTIKTSNPKAKILFVATISPNKRRYAEGKVELSSEQKAQWTEERIAYIKNHIDFAKAHQIPLVNIYEKSLNSEGDGNLDYISTADFIHPSPSGVYFISEQIAKYIFENKILN